MADNADDPRKSICDQKQFEMRQNIISELLKTENDYVTSLTLCLKTFSESKGCPAILDLNVLFGNAHEVVQLSQKLLALLEVNVEERSFDEQVVGMCFYKYVTSFYSEQNLSGVFRISKRGPNFC